MVLTPDQYAAKMRRLECMRNEARRRCDAPAIAALHAREDDLNRTFWGRLPRRAM